MAAEVVEAVGVDVLDPVGGSACVALLTATLTPSSRVDNTPTLSSSHPLLLLSFINKARGNRSRATYTLDAHLVTFLPSFKQSNSPLPPASVLHCM